MIHKLSTLKEQMTSQIKSKGRSRYVEAFCPICPFTYSVDIYGSDDVAKAAARERVIRHIKSDHSDAIDTEH